jgi:hypothetical protein
MDIFIPVSRTGLDFYKIRGVIEILSPSQSIYPLDDIFDPVIYIVHFVLSRQFDFGRESYLNLIQEQ